MEKVTPATQGSASSEQWCDSVPAAKRRGIRKRRDCRTKLCVIKGVRGKWPSASRKDRAQSSPKVSHANSKDVCGWGGSHSVRRCHSN